MPGISYSLGLDPSKGIAGLSAMRGALGGFTGLVGKIGPLLAAAGVAMGLGGAAAGIKAALDLGGTLTDLSNRTGESIAKLVTFRQALADTGVGADSAGQLISL